MPNADDLLRQALEVAYTLSPYLEQTNPHQQSQLNIFIENTRNAFGRNFSIQKIHQLEYAILHMEQQLHRFHHGTGTTGTTGIVIPRKGNKKGSPEALAWGRRLAEMKRAKRERLYGSQFY